MYKILRITPSGTKTLEFETQAEAAAALKALEMGAPDMDVELEQEDLDEEMEDFVENLDPDTATAAELRKFKQYSNERLSSIENTLLLALEADRRGLDSPLAHIGVDTLVLPVATVEHLASIVDAYRTHTNHNIDVAIARRENE